MIPRIISARPFISLATLLVLVVCIFFIQKKERSVREDASKLVIFNERATLPVMTSLPFSINYEPDASKDLLYRKVRLEGAFLPNHQVYLENRVSEDSPKPSSKKTSGFHIMMPFLLNTGQIVWVNRGWIARDVTNRQNIPDVNPPIYAQTITGYITLSKKDIFEMPSEPPHFVNGHVVALNFYLHDDKNDLPNRNVYPFLITQTGGGSDGLIRPEDNFYYVPDYRFDIQSWWITLWVAIGFWLISGLKLLRSTLNDK